MSDAYFVRQADTGEPVGVFAVEARADLYRLVDECCDPNVCEIARCPPGGVFWAARVSTQWPGTDEFDDPFPAGAMASESWAAALFTETTKLRWSPLVEAATNV